MIDRKQPVSLEDCYDRHSELLADFTSKLGVLYGEVNNKVKFGAWLTVTLAIFAAIGGAYLFTFAKISEEAEARDQAYQRMQSSITDVRVNSTNAITASNGRIDVLTISINSLSDSVKALSQLLKEHIMSDRKVSLSPTQKARIDELARKADDACEAAHLSVDGATSHE